MREILRLHGVTATDPVDPSSSGLPSVYSPAAVETKLYERWVERGYFTADVTSAQAALHHRVAASERDRASCTWVTLPSTR